MGDKRGLSCGDTSVEGSQGTIKYLGVSYCYKKRNAPILNPCGELRWEKVSFTESGTKRTRGWNSTEKKMKRYEGNACRLRTDKNFTTGTAKKGVEGAGWRGYPLTGEEGVD